MPNTREIQSRIKSIQDTRKITNAMYMISSTKLKKAKKSLEQTEPYFYTLQAMIARILRHLPPEARSEYFHSRHEGAKILNRGLVVVSGDKGLAGAFNHNVLKLAEDWLKEPGNNKIYTVGEVGRQYFIAKNIPIEMEFHYTTQNPTMHRARLITGSLIEAFLTGDLDEVWVVFTRMENSVAEEVELVKLLPLEKRNFYQNTPIVSNMEEFAMLPSPQKVLETIVPNYIQGFMYGALVESYCSEQNARMQAMENATDSANAMLKSLTIAYNRARQAAITQEITEIISGAKAQKKKKEMKKLRQKRGVAL